MAFISEIIIFEILIATYMTFSIDSIPYEHRIRSDHRLCSYHLCPDHKAIQTVVTREVYIHIQMASVTPQRVTQPSNSLRIHN